MKTYELKATTQKSYYRKAYVIQDENNNIYLQSYNTIVCGIINGSFTRFWGDYSVTTMNHVNDFRRLYNLTTINKKAWNNIPVTSCNIATQQEVVLKNFYYGGYNLAY